TEGYASLDFSTREGTLIRPSEGLRRGEIDLDGLDLTQPAAIKERVFGKILRVDRVQTEGPEPLALELRDFVQASRGESRPKVDGDDALRAMRLADQVLQSLRGHDWEGVVPASEPVSAGHALRGPISWRLQGQRSSATPASGSSFAGDLSARPGIGNV
ncbi:MAG: hypothetical protein AB7I30_16970, partial [Isosphaeraceae bacterium]